VVALGAEIDGDESASKIYYRLSYNLALDVISAHPSITKLQVRRRFHPYTVSAADRLGFDNTGEETKLPISVYIFYV